MGVRTSKELSTHYPRHKTSPLELPSVIWYNRVRFCTDAILQNTYYITVSPMFDADVSLSPLLSDDDDLLAPWDDTDDTALPVEPDEEDDLIVPKPALPLGDDEEDDDLGLLPDDFEEDM